MFDTSHSVLTAQISIYLPPFLGKLASLFPVPLILHFIPMYQDILTESSVPTLIIYFVLLIQFTVQPNSEKQFKDRFLVRSPSPSSSLEHDAKELDSYVC